MSKQTPLFIILTIVFVCSFLLYLSASADTWCHTFNTNLGYAQSNASDIVTKLEVAYLHLALLDQGISFDPDGAFAYSAGTS